MRLGRSARAAEHRVAASGGSVQREVERSGTFGVVARGDEQDRATIGGRLEHVLARSEWCVAGRFVGARREAAGLRRDRPRETAARIASNEGTRRDHSAKKGPTIDSSETFGQPSLHAVTPGINAAAGHSTAAQRRPSCGCTKAVQVAVARAGTIRPFPGADALPSPQPLSSHIANPEAPR